MNKDNGGPAFPVERRSPELSTDFNGMTLLQYTAIKAMQGILSGGVEPSTKAHFANIAEDARIMAESMLAEFAK